MSTMDRSTTAFQELIGTMRQHWANQLYPALHQRFEQATAGQSVTDSAEAGQAVEELPLYHWFCFIERHYQRMKYSDPRWGLAAALSARPDWVAEQLHPPQDSAYLRLRPELPLPAYYSAIDIHQHPGNLVGADYDGLMYRASATSIHPNTRRFEAHERMAQWLQSQGNFLSVLDMGCGFGKCGFPIARHFEQAQVLGIDLSAPCLRLAARTAEQEGLRNIRFEQADAAQVPYEDASFDLVTSTQLLHELPVEVISQVLAESYRLLKPGGLVAHLDFRARQPWPQFLIEGHSVRNNEGFLPGFNRMDIAAAYLAAGFEPVRIEPFAETEGATRADWPYWRFPWTLFWSRKPA
jgi:ubiquinone/menaquinone biosynthesis C-methylase UbiE